MSACLRACTPPPLGFAVALTLLATLAACAPEDDPGANVALDTDAQRASYAIGRNIASSLGEIEDLIDRPALLRGVSDGLAGIGSALTDDEMQAAIVAFNRTVAMAQNERAQDARAEGVAFLAENANAEGVTTTESGLQYRVLREGEGDSPEAGARVLVHYRGTLIDGTEFDSSYGGDPASFSLDGVIDGFAEAIMLMRVGGHLRAFLPSDLAYGDAGSGSIGPGQVLIFEIELLGIE